MTLDLSRRGFVQLGMAGGLGALLTGPFARQALAQGVEALTIAFPGDVPNWDPNARTHVVGHSLYKCVFSQPLTLTTDLKTAPELITQWRQIGTDGKALELEFRDDATFHNGDKFSAEDFRFTFFERPKAEQLDITGIWRRVEDIEVLSPTKAVMKFSSPMPSAISWLSFLASFIVPKAYMQKVGKEEFLKKPVGSGPYKIVEYQQNARIVMEAHDRHYAGAPAFKQVTFEILRDVSSRTAAITAKRVALAVEIPVREVSRLEKLPGLKARTEPFTDIYVLQINNTGVFEDKRVRLAAHHAIDKVGLSRALFNNVAKPLSVPAAVGSPGNPADFVFPYDVAKATALMAEAGFTPQKPAELTLLSTNGVFPGDYEMCQAIAQMWLKIGIKATIEVIEFVQYQERLRAKTLKEATIYRWGNMTGDPELYSGYLLNPKFPFAAWRTDDMSAKLDPLFVEMDEAKRAKGYQEAAKYAVENGYNIPLLQGVITTVHQSNLNYVAYGNGWIMPQLYKPA